MGSASFSKQLLVIIVFIEDYFHLKIYTHLVSLSSMYRTVYVGLSQNKPQ